jgi:hypothetical protein
MVRITPGSVARRAAVNNGMREEPDAELAEFAELERIAALFEDAD